MTPTPADACAMCPSAEVYQDGLCAICFQLAHPERKMSKSAGAYAEPTPEEIEKAVGRRP